MECAERETVRRATLLAILYLFVLDALTMQMVLHILVELSRSRSDADVLQRHTAFLAFRNILLYQRDFFVA